MSAVLLWLGLLAHAAAARGGGRLRAGHLGAPASGQTVYSIADLHGDFDHFRAIVEGLGLATFQGQAPTWTGNASILVSTGDIADRGAHDLPIFRAFAALAPQAAQAGGEVVNVLGNHEVMNMEGSFGHVNPVEFTPEGDYGGKVNREKAFLPDGFPGRDLRERYVTAAVRGGALFVHGGLDPEMLQHRSLQALNLEIRAMLALAKPQVYGSQELLVTRGPFWNRFFAQGPEDEVCSLVKQTLSIVGAKRMVVGHTIQDGGVTTRCPHAEIILADTAISSFYGNRSKISAVEQPPDGSVWALYFGEAAGRGVVTERQKLWPRDAPAGREAPKDREFREPRARPLSEPTTRTPRAPEGSA